jgi:hypothetical protein
VVAWCEFRHLKWLLLLNNSNVIMSGIAVVPKRSGDDGRMVAERLQVRF